MTLAHRLRNSKVDSQKGGFTQSRKGSKDAKKTGNEITALNSAIYSLLLCVFAAFASLRETRLSLSFNVRHSLRNLAEQICREVWIEILMLKVVIAWSYFAAIR